MHVVEGFFKHKGRVTRDAAFSSPCKNQPWKDRELSLRLG